MVFIEVRTPIYDHVDKKLIDRRRTIINMECIRRVGKTDNGWAKIYWTTRVDPLVLAETYKDFVLRLSQEYVVITLDADDD